MDVNCIDLTRVFDENDQNIRSDIYQMIVDFLNEEHLFSAAVVLQDEAKLRFNEASHKRYHTGRLRKLILNGDWELCIKDQRTYLYHVHRQEYFELIDGADHHRAFNFLTKKLKPLEDIAMAQHPNEFKELCYLVTCKAVSESDLFRSWCNPAAQREILADELQTSLNRRFSDINGFDYDATGTEGIDNRSYGYDPHRLTTLLRQGIAYQIIRKNSNNNHLQRKKRRPAPQRTVDLNISKSSISATASIVDSKSYCQSKALDRPCIPLSPPVPPEPPLRCSLPLPLPFPLPELLEEITQTVEKDNEWLLPTNKQELMVQTVTCSQLSTTNLTIGPPSSSSPSPKESTRVNSVLLRDQEESSKAASSSIPTPSKSITMDASTADSPQHTVTPSDAPPPADTSPSMSSRSLHGKTSFSHANKTTYTSSSSYGPPPPPPPGPPSQPAPPLLTPPLYPCVKSLTRDYNPVTIPNRALAMLIPNLTSTYPNTSDPTPSSSILRCMTMLGASDASLDVRGGEVLMVIGGTDQGLLLWNVISPTAADSHLEGEEEEESKSTSTHTANLAEGESSQLLHRHLPLLYKPSDILHLAHSTNSMDRGRDSDRDRDRRGQSSTAAASSKSSGPVSVTGGGGGGGISLTVKVRDVTSDGRGSMVAAALSDGGVLLVSLSTGDSSDGQRCFGSELGRITGAHTGDVCAVDFHGDGSHVLSGGFDGSVAILDLVSLSCVKSLRGHCAAISNVQCNGPGNMILSSSRDGVIKFWDLLSGLCVYTYPYSGSASAAASDDKLSIGSSRCRIDVTSARLSRDGKYLLVSSRFAATRLVDVRTGSVVARYTSSPQRGSGGNSFGRADYVADGEVVAVGCDNCQMALYHSLTGSPFRTLSIPPPMPMPDPFAVAAAGAAHTNSYATWSSQCTSCLQNTSLFRAEYHRPTGFLAGLGNGGIVLWGE